MNFCSHYKGQRHEGKSVHVSGPEGTTVGPFNFARNWIAENYGREKRRV